MQIARLWWCFRIACHLHLPAPLDLHSPRMQRRLCTPYHQMVIRWDPSLAFANLQIYSSSIAQEVGVNTFSIDVGLRLSVGSPKIVASGVQTRVPNPAELKAWSIQHSSCRCNSRSKLTTNLFNDRTLGGWMHHAYSAARLLLLMHLAMPFSRTSLPTGWWECDRHVWNVLSCKKLHFPGQNSCKDWRVLPKNWRGCGRRSTLFWLRNVPLTIWGMFKATLAYLWSCA